MSRPDITQLRRLFVCPFRIIYIFTCQFNTFFSSFSCTEQKMKFCIEDLFSKCDQILSFLRDWSHLLKKSLMENFIFCAVLFVSGNSSFYEFPFVYRFYITVKWCWGYYNQFHGYYYHPLPHHMSPSSVAMVSIWLYLDKVRLFIVPLISVTT